MHQFQGSSQGDTDQGQSAHCPLRWDSTRRRSDRRVETWLVKGLLWNCRELIESSTNYRKDNTPVTVGTFLMNYQKPLLKLQRFDCWTSCYSRTHYLICSKVELSMKTQCLWRRNKTGEPSSRLQLPLGPLALMTRNVNVWNKMHACKTQKQTWKHNEPTVTAVTFLPFLRVTALGFAVLQQQLPGQCCHRWKPHWDQNWY